VTCALFKGKEKVDVLDRKDFNGDLVSNVDNAMTFLERHISVRYEFDGSPQRKEIPSVPFEALREAVVNALIHRNYFEKGANVMVEIFSDRIEISSPGGLVKGLKEEDFGTKSILRNPILADLFHRINYIERMGTGINRMQKFMKDAGKPPIKFKFTGFVSAIFLLADLQETSVKTSVKIREMMTKNPNVTIPEIAEALSKTPRTIEMQIKSLRESKKIRRIGPAKGGRWEVNKSS